MTYNELADLVFDGLQPVLAEHVGVQLYAMEREKFDGWLHVELCRIMVQHGLHPEPTDKLVDLVFGKWALDVRTINTNIPHDGCRAKGRPIKKEIDDLIKDIWKLTNPGKALAAPHRGVLLLAFPTTQENERWQSVHLSQIRSELTQLLYREFEFKGNIPGVLYLGLCSEN